ncbi:MAG: nucleoside deaminase [Clostridiales bacterium]|nr:nucleoside deaminase [Clostridiales bacterium]
MDSVLHEKYMRLALHEARKAAAADEVPVGAVLVRDGEVIAAGHNLCETENDPALHAECIVLREAQRKLGNLQDCTLFVTLEPCAMCAGAILNYRLPELVFGAFDARAGCCGSRIDLTDHWFYHSVKTRGGLLEGECGSLLTAFFEGKREKK